MFTTRGSINTETVYLSVGIEPPDGFEPPYEPYEDPVLPLYDEGINAIISHS